jgi:hypothetical protein
MGNERHIARRIAPFILTVTLVVGMPTAVYAHHNGYKYSAPTLNSLSVVSCTEVRVTWKRTSNFTSINYAERNDFLAALNWHAWENGTRDEVRRDTSAVVPNLRPGKRHYFRVYASEYGGHRLSRYSNVKSIYVPAC